MPLPDKNIAWPPKTHAPAFAAMAVDDAWYTGDTDALADNYQRMPAIRPSQYQGGLVGTVARFFWGRPTSREQSNTRIHLPVPSDLATTSADLLFSEAPRILMPEGTATSRAQDRIDAIINTPDMHSRWLEAAEVSAALGGVYLRLVWDTEFADHVMVDPVHADRAVPEFRWGKLSAVTFWTQLGSGDNGVVLRHLERHESGRILHGLYRGDLSHLGMAIPVQEHPDTEWLAEVIDAEGGINTGVQDLTCTYIPNIRPNRKWRNYPEISSLGRSDYEGVEPLFDALDETYSSWMRDIRLAKARLIVPEAYLESTSPGRRKMFDDDQEIFTPITALGKMGDATLEAHQFAIRNEEHRATSVEILRAILRSAGYSASTFGDDPMAVSTTATEIKARERMSERTRDKKSRYWAAALGPFIRTLLNVDAQVFPGNGSATDEIPEVKFQETVQKDPLELAQTAKELRTAEAASTETLVRMQHPNWDGPTVDEEVARIQKERGSASPDPFGFGASTQTPINITPPEGGEPEEDEEDEAVSS